MVQGHPEPGIFDRAFNPTLGIVQQPLWRIWRALNDEDIDLFSRQGLMDPALLPIAGMAFSQRNAVMPHELFGDNVGAQIAGSILTDPFSFMTSAATLPAKAAKLLQGTQGSKHAMTLARASRAARGLKAGDEAAHLGVKEFGEIVKNTKVGNMMDTLDEGLSTGKFKVGTQSGDEVTEALVKADDYEYFQNLRDKLLGSNRDDTLHDVMGKGRDRQMGLSLPILGDLFGVQANVSKSFQQQHGGWMGYYKSLVGGFYKKGTRVLVAPVEIIGKSALPGMPFLAKQASKVDGFVSRLGLGEIGEGYRHGADTPIQTSGVRNFQDSPVTPERMQAVLGKAGNDLYKRVASYLEDYDRLAQLPGFEKNIHKLNLSAEDWELLRGNKIFDGPRHVAGGEGTNLLHASDVEDLRLYLDEINAAELGYQTIGPKLTARGDETIGFELGQSLKLWKNKIFKTDFGLDGLEGITDARNRTRAKTNAYLQQRARDLIAKVADVAKENGVDAETIERINLGVMGLQPTEGEWAGIAGAFRAADDMPGAYKMLDEWFSGHVTNNLEFLLTVTTEGVTGGTAGIWDDLHKMVGKWTSLEEYSGMGSYRVSDNIAFLPEQRGAVIRSSGHPEFKRLSFAFGNEGPSGIVINRMSGKDLRILLKKYTDLSKKGVQADDFTMRADMAAIRDALGLRGRKQLPDLSGLKETVEDTVHRYEYSELVNPANPKAVLDLEDLPEIQAARMKEMDEFGQLFMDMQLKRASLQTWVEQNGHLGHAPPMSFFEGLHDDISRLGKKVEDAALAPLGQGGQDLLEAHKRIRTDAMKMAQDNDLLRDINPLGYMHRVMTSTESAKIVKAMGEFSESTGGQQMQPYVRSLFSRGNRDYTIGELNSLHAQLAKNANTSAPARVLRKRIEDTLKSHFGDDWSSREFLSESPTDIMISHLAGLKEVEDTRHYYREALESKAAKKAGIVSGKVVGIVDNHNSPRMTRHRFSRVNFRTVGDETEKLGTDLHLSQDAEWRQNPNMAFVVKQADGSETLVHADVLENGMSVNAYGFADSLDEAIPQVLRKPAQTQSGPVLIRDQADEFVGQYVSFAPKPVNEAVVSEIASQAPTKMAGLLRGYDALHSMAKMLATNMNIPVTFHTANVVSSVPQMMMNGVGPLHTGQGMMMAARMFFGDMDEFVRHDEVTQLLQLGKGQRTGVGAGPRLINTFAGERAFGEITRQARRRAGGVEAEELIIYSGKGRTFTFDEVIDAMMDNGALDTQTMHEIRAGKAVPEMLKSVRHRLTGSMLTKTVLESGETLSAAGEASEFFARFTGMFGALNAGMDVDTAARTVAQSMVDYSKLTTIERTLMKRLAFFYTFPRHIVPQVIKRGLENPSKTAALVHGVLGDHGMVATDDGRVEMRWDEYRVNLSRLAPQFDGFTTLGAMADILGLGEARRATGEGPVDRPITPSGVLGVAGWGEFFEMEDPLRRGTGFLEEASRLNWVSKIFAGHGGPFSQPRNPNVSYTPLEQAARQLLPFRKVAKNAEETRKRARLQIVSEELTRDYKRSLALKDKDGAEAASNALQKVYQSMGELAKRGGSAVHW